MKMASSRTETKISPISYLPSICWVENFAVLGFCSAHTLCVIATMVHFTQSEREWPPKMRNEKKRTVLSESNYHHERKADSTRTHAGRSDGRASKTRRCRAGRARSGRPRCPPVRQRCEYNSLTITCTGLRAHTTAQCQLWD